MKNNLMYGACAALLLSLSFFSCDNKDKDEDPLSTEAKITSFTFDASIAANSIVTSTPVINGNSITFTVDGMADDMDMGKLEPTIAVSEGATYSFSGSFSLGMQYVVTAEDGKTTNTYTALAQGSLFDVYSGLLDVSVGGSPLVSDLPYNIALSKESDTELSVNIMDFSIEIPEMATIDLGDVVIPCAVTKPENDYVFSGTYDLGTVTVNEVPAECVVNVVNASVVDGTFTLPMVINVTMTQGGVVQPMQVSAEFVGTPMEE